jgi:hypothetical protein
MIRLFMLRRNTFKAGCQPLFSARRAVSMTLAPQMGGQPDRRLQFMTQATPTPTTMHSKRLRAGHRLSPFDPRRGGLEQRGGGDERGNAKLELVLFR